MKFNERKIVFYFRSKSWLLFFLLRWAPTTASWTSYYKISSSFKSSEKSLHNSLSVFVYHVFRLSWKNFYKKRNPKWKIISRYTSLLYRKQCRKFLKPLNIIFHSLWTFLNETKKPSLFLQFLLIHYWSYLNEISEQKTCIFMIYITY